MTETEIQRELRNSIFRINILKATIEKTLSEEELRDFSEELEKEKEKHKALKREYSKLKLNKDERGERNEKNIRK